MPPQLRDDTNNQLFFFSNRKLYMSSSYPCFFYVAILCGRLTFQRIHGASPNPLPFQVRKSRTPVNSAVKFRIKLRCVHFLGKFLLDCWLTGAIPMDDFSKSCNSRRICTDYCMTRA